MEVAGPLGTPLGLAQRKRASPRGEAGTSGFLSVSDSDRRVPAELAQDSQASSCLRKGTPLASRVAQGVSGPSSSCVWNPRVFADDAWKGGDSLPLSHQGHIGGSHIYSGQDWVGDHCTKPSGVPRAPPKSTVCLTSQRHPGKFPKVPGRRRG